MTLPAGPAARVALVGVSLIFVWGLGLPWLLSLDRFAASVAWQLGTGASAIAGLATFTYARWRSRAGLRATFPWRVASALVLSSTATALIAWLIDRGDPRMPEIESFSLLCLQLATGWAAALWLYVLAQAPPGEERGARLADLPGIRRVFTGVTAVLGLLAAVLLGVGSAGRAAGVRDAAEGERVAPLARLIGQALEQSADPKVRYRLEHLLDADLRADAELRPIDAPPPPVVEGDPGWAAADAPDGVRRVLVGGRRWHYARHRVGGPEGDSVLWVAAPANVPPPIQAPGTAPGMMILALLLLGAPLAAYALGADLAGAIDQVTRGLLAMGPGQPPEQAPTAVPVQDNDELGDLGLALDRLCHRLGLQSAALRADLAAAEAVDRTRSRFLATASHALQVPLHRIADHCGVLARAGDLNAAQAEDLQAIVDGTDQLMEHVGEILSLSQMQAGHDAPLQLGTVSVGDLARKVVAARRVDASPQVTVAVSVDPGTPTIQADGHRVRQVLENLVGNAIKFTREGFVEVGVGPAYGGGVHVQVADSGPGIPRDELERVFTEFHRVEAHRQVAGTGLGLAITQRFVARHRGSLWAESVLGEGSVFHVRLPQDPHKRSGQRPGPAP